MIVLDSNVLSELMRHDALPTVIAWFDRQARGSGWTSAVSVYEVLRGLEAIVAGARRSASLGAFHEMIADDLGGRVLLLDRNAAEATAELDAERKRRGRIMEARDTLIAGIAIANRATLATRNARYFVGLPTPVVDAWEAP